MAQSPIMVSPRRRVSIELPPFMSGSTLRILLLGKSASDSSRVGNVILGRSALGGEAPADVVERVGGRVKDKHVTLINSPHLLQTDISDHQITQTLRECVRLSDPGPHVIVLTLQHRDFTEEDMRRVRHVLLSFSPEALRRSIIITTDQERVNEFIQEFTAECGGGRLQFEETKPEWSSELLNRVNEMLKEKQQQYLTCEIIHDVKESSVSEDDGKAKERQKEESDQAVTYSPASRKRSSLSDIPPNMSESTLRILLLGKSVSDSSRVGNVILGRSALDGEVPADVERVGGRVKDRRVTLINSPHLLQTDISDHQITQTLKECVRLSDPGPHVIVLTLQHRDFTEEDMRRVRHVLLSFSPEALRRSIIITTDQERVNEFIQEFTAECGGGRLDTEQWRSILFTQIEKILLENSQEFLTSDPSEEESFGELSSSFYSLRTEEESGEELEGKSLETEKSKKKSFLRSISIASFLSGQKSEQERAKGVSGTSTQRLNLLLCGSDGRLKTSISKLIRGKKKFLSSLHQKECLKKDVELHGRLLSVVELPALFNTGLSEEEVMHRVLQCLSLCDAGVHAFLLIIPDAPMTDESKAEIKEIQRIFSSRINKHVMIIIIQEKSIIHKLFSRKSSLYYTSLCEATIQTFGGKQFVLEDSSQVPDLLQYVEDMVRENGGSLYTTFTYFQAQLELERNKHKAEIEELRESVAKTQTAAGDGLRIVLLGKTGVGKSASGNTILRKQAFESLLASESVTRECLKETSYFKRRQIAVIDTPGLFDTGVDNVEVRKEIVKCVSMAAPGPHVFLLVIQLGRFTQEEKDAVKMIQETFGDQSRMYTMVLFTRGDDLRGTRIEDFVKGNRSLQCLILQCGQRYHVFNNKDSNDRKQVSELLDKIDCMVTANGGSFYTNEMFLQVENNIREEQERIMNQRKDQMKKKAEELRVKYETEIEQMKEENERERLEMLNDLIKCEEEFKKKEEEIKKEKDESLQKELQRKLEEQQKLFEEESKRKEKALGEQQQNFIKYLEEKHEKEKQKLKKQIECEIRQQAELEYRIRLDSEVSKALKEAEENLPNIAKRAREWGQYGGFVGAAAGSVVGSYQDIVSWIISVLEYEAQKQIEA